MVVTNILSAQVVVVGGGPAGMAAAVAAAEAGAHVLLVDDNPSLGGQIYRQYPEEFGTAAGDRLGLHDQRGDELLDQTRRNRSRIETWTDSRVWAIFERNRLEIDRGGELVTVHADALVLAPGAPERPVPFPGWTLPGVITAGAAQVLMKQQAILPGRRVAMSGTGPLQQIVAQQLAKAGAEDVTMADPVAATAYAPHMLSLLQEPAMMKTGVKLRLELMRRRVKVHWSHLVTAVKGDGRVEEAVLARVDDEWRPIPGTEFSILVDTVCIGFGQIPDIGLSYMAGCRHEFDSVAQAWVPERNSMLETTVAGVFAAGDGAGVAGAIVAALEGELAGIGAARSTGAYAGKGADGRSRTLQRRLARLSRFRTALDRVSTIRSGLAGLADDETIICRCEELTKANIMVAVDEGLRHVNEIKKRTRAGMGMCQGRMCAPAIGALVSATTSANPHQIGQATVRPPLGHVTLGSLVEHASPRRR